MKKKLFTIVLIVFFTFTLTGCSNKGGNISNVMIKEVASSTYTATDIKQACDVILKEFREDWSGCTLNELYYSGDEFSSSYQDWATRNNADEVIVLLSSFAVDASGGDGSLNPNSTYTGWNWILVRDKGSSWEHVDHGY